MDSKRWIADRATIARARALDRLYIDDPEYFDFMDIYFANGDFSFEIIVLKPNPPTAQLS